MAGRWDEEARREDWRSQADRRDPRDRYEGREDRSFERDERVFGERESGAGYNRPPREAEDWQDRDYGGVSPAMKRGDYDTGYRANPRFQNQDYTRGGGRFYGDDGRARLYREEYGYGGGDAQGRRFGSREADERWAREMRRGRPFSGGTGGYDYERGYGDGGREERGGDAFEDRAREAGEFFRRTGRRISNWFSDVAGEGAYDHGYGENRQRYDVYRGARGLGPKGYKRSDERISDDAHQRLTDDPWLDATHIDLAVAGGEVTLSGTVDSREAKHRAERIVEDLSGVHHVQNNLRVQHARQDAPVRTDGDAAMQTSANATGTTTRKN